MHSKAVFCFFESDGELGSIPLVCLKRFFTETDDAGELVPVDAGFFLLFFFLGVPGVDFCLLGVIDTFSPLLCISPCETGIGNELESPRLEAMSFNAVFTLSDADGIAIL